MKSEMYEAISSWCSMFIVHIFLLSAVSHRPVFRPPTSQEELFADKNTFQDENTLDPSYACICDSMVLFSQSGSVVEILSITEFTCKQELQMHYLLSGHYDCHDVQGCCCCNCKKCPTIGQLINTPSVKDPQCECGFHISGFSS